MHAQIHLEVSRAAELVAVGVSKRTGSRNGKSSWVKVVATQIRRRTRTALADSRMGLRGLPIENVEVSHEVSSGPIGAVHRERQTGHGTDNGVELPASKNGITYTM